MKTKRTELPTVEKEIPLPVIKYHPKTRASRSRWVDFLLALVPGDSFVIQPGESQTVMIQAKRLGLFITWRNVEGGLRVWLVPEEKIPAKPKMKWLPDEKKQVPFPVAKQPPQAQRGFEPLDVSLL